MLLGVLVSTPSEVLVALPSAWHGITDDLLVSAPIIHELNEVLSREKFDPFLLREERERFLVALLREASFVDITVSIKECRDPKDDKFLELAVSGNADVIVSGDDDLLVLDPFRDIRIVTPREFLDFSL